MSKRMLVAGQFYKGNLAATSMTDGVVTYYGYSRLHSYELKEYTNNEQTVAIGRVSNGITRENVVYLKVNGSLIACEPQINLNDGQPFIGDGIVVLMPTNITINKALILWANGTCQWVEL